MALVPATITVNFTANYAGPHRVCYRTNMSGGYTCVNVTCTGGGATCTATISIMVDNTSCSTVEFDGYVQPTCQDISSTDGRTPFSVTFTPSPACQSWLVACDTVSVYSFNVTVSGSGYNPSSPPSVSITGGSGSGATANVVVGAGALALGVVTLIGGGSGYTNGTYTSVPFLGGSGSGATATVIISGGVVTSITITAAGTGYLSTDVLRPDPSHLGPSTPVTNSTFNAPSDYGKVTAVNLIAGGVGYTTAPTVVIAPPVSGSTASATAILGNCPVLKLTDCGGNTVNTAGLAVGTNVNVCSNSVPTLGVGYSVSQAGACACNCTTYTLTVSGAVESSLLYGYYTCAGTLVSGHLYTSGSPSSITFCASTNGVGVVLSPGATYTLTSHGAC